MDIAQQLSVEKFHIVRELICRNQGRNTMPRLGYKQLQYLPNSEIK